MIYLRADENEAGVMDEEPKPLSDARMSELHDVLDSHPWFDCTNGHERRIIDDHIAILFAECDRLRDTTARLQAENKRLVKRVLEIANDIAAAGINGFGNQLRAAIGK